MLSGGPTAAGRNVNRIEPLLRLGRTLLRPPVRQRIVLALWLLIAAAIAVRLTVMLGRPILPGDPWRGSGTARYFLDFRDTIWTPGRYLLSGGNPYDPVAYQAAYPWALAFSLYAPAWLLLAALLAPLPYLVSIMVFQALSLVAAIVMLRVICRWTMPTLADLAVPAALLWMNVWYPGRGALSVQLTTLLAVLGTALVLRSVTQWPRASHAEADTARARPWRRGRRRLELAEAAVRRHSPGRHRGWASEGGLAGDRRARAPVAASTGRLYGGVGRTSRLRYAPSCATSRSRTLPTTPAASPSPTSDGSTCSASSLDTAYSIRPHGCRSESLSWASSCFPVLVIRLTRRPLPVAAVVCTAMLLGIYHGTYDLLVLFVPVAIGIGMALRGELKSAADRIAAGALLIVLHLQTISKRLIPGLDVRGADTVNLVLILVALAAGLWSAVADRRRVARRPGEGALSATGRTQSTAPGEPTTT